MFNAKYKSQTGDHPSSSYCNKEIFFLLLLTFYITSFAAGTMLHTFTLKKNPCFTTQRFQEDTATRPISTVAHIDTAKEYILAPGENFAEKIRKNLWVRADADKTEYYVGEPVVVTYKLYSRLIAKSRISKQPVLSGFTVYDMIDYVSATESTELIRDRSFKVHILRKAQLIPLQTGTMQLDPIEVDNSVHFVRGNSAAIARGNSLEDLMNKLSTEESLPSADMPFKIQSSPVKIVIKSFPESNRPEDFNGAVGRFNIKAAITTKSLSVNDAGVLTVEIKGRGNVSLIDAPLVKWPAGIDTLEIRTSEKINKTVAPLSGTKTFEYVFTPLRAGVFRIPPISFSFFNATSRTYQTIQTQPNTFEVAAGNKPPLTKQITDSSVSQKKNINSLNTVTKYLKSQFMWITIVGTLLVFSIYLWQKNKRLQKKELEDSLVVPVENKKDLPEKIQAEENTDILGESRTSLEKEDYKKFYEHLNNVLWNEIAARLKLPLSELNKQNITLALKRRGWTDEMAGELESVLVKCERNIYLSDYHQETDAATVFESAEKLVKCLNNV